MHLYKVKPNDRTIVHVVARTPSECADIFVCWRASKSEVPAYFAIACVPIDSLEAEQKQQVSNAIAASLVGVVHLDGHAGWTFSPPMWVPLVPDELASLKGGPACS